MDALQALRIAVGLDTSNGPATYEDYIAADIDGSGSVNSMDALNILKYAVGLDAPDPHWVFIRQRCGPLSYKANLGELRHGHDP